MSRISPKEKLILGSVLWLVVFGGMLLGVLLPLYVRLEQFGSSFEAGSAKLADLEHSIQGYVETKREYDRIEEKAALIRAQFVKQDDALSFIESLETLARENHLFQEIRLMEEPIAGKNDNASAFVFSVTLAGSFNDTMIFIAELEHFKYAVDVTYVQMKPVQAGQTYGDKDDPESFVSSANDVASHLIVRVYSAL